MNRPFGYISLLLLSAIIILTCWQSYKVIHFYSNQDQIEAKYCENLERPELNCHGQCHLQKQLQTPEQKVENKAQQINSSIIVFQAFEHIDNYFLAEYKLKLAAHFYTQPLFTEGISAPLLDPPELIS